MSLSLSRVGRNNPAPETFGPNPSAPSAGEERVPAQKTPDQLLREQDKEELMRRFKLMFQEARDHWKEWRQEAVECFDFVGGRQWSDEDRNILSDQGRPAVTFNRVQPFVDGVSGLEIGNRQTTQFIPRQIENSGVNELLTGACEWARDECDADFEESETFRDAIVCGVGCTQTRLDYDEQPQGSILIERVDPLEVYPDPSSRKPNFSDARFIIRVKDVPVTTAEELFPQFNAYELHARWAEDEPSAERMPHNARLAPYYRIDQSGEINRERMQCRLVEVEWWDYQRMFRIADPQTGELRQVEAGDAGKLRLLARMHGQQLQMVKGRRKKFYKAIVGNVVLACTRGADEGGFTYKFITGKRDRNLACWYGLVRAMRDPQMWANKFMSQSLHIVNTNAKGGLLAETDAFVDLEEARNDWSEADSIIELNPGGLAKVKQKDIPQFPVQINQMMATALEAIPATAGVNLEMIAQQQQEQPGILEMQRKQQGMTVLSFIFNAKRRYQKEQGRLMLWMIITFISDGRLIRIGGADNRQYVRLVRQPGLTEYDVIIDDAPTSPNMKERVWGMIMQMFPVLAKLPLPPQAMLEFMKYAPFPASLITKLQSMVMQQGNPNQNPQMQSVVALNQAKAQHAQAQAALAQAKAGQTGADTMHRVAQAKHAGAEALLLPMVTQSEMDERTAGITLKEMQAFQALSTGVNQLQNAGISPVQAAEEAELARNEFEHKQQLEMGQHALEVMKATAPPPPPSSQGPSGGPGGPSAGGGPGGPGGAPPPAPPPPGPPGAADTAAMHAMSPMMQLPPMGPTPGPGQGPTPPFGARPPMGPMPPPM